MIEALKAFGIVCLMFSGLGIVVLIGLFLFTLVVNSDRS